MKYILSLFMVCYFAAITLAQHTNSRITTYTTLNTSMMSSPTAYSINTNGPFMAYSLKMEEEIEGLSIRFSADGQQWSEWKPVLFDTHQEEGDQGVVSQLQFIDMEVVGFYQIKALENVINSIRCDFFNPGFTRENQNNTINAISSRDCPCPLPSFQDRNDWCPDGDCPEIQNPTYTEVSHLIVHHAAGTNTSSDWAAVVRSIWDFHVNVNEWDDVGYNWLIDPNGVIYQGRGNDVRGAHFCGMNTNTMGICLLGNYTDITPTSATRTSLKELLAWKCCDRDLPPLGEGVQASSGETFMHISGHRDGCATACPGDAFYPQMPDVRQDVFDYLVTGCSGLPGATQLEATLTGSNEATLNWQDNTTDELGYILERKEGNDDFGVLTTVAADEVTYIDNTVDETLFYTYRIRAYTATDTSAYSNEATVGMPLNNEDVFFNQHTVQLFPNPAQANITIAIDNAMMGDIEIVITNVLGELMLQTTMSKQTTQSNIELNVSTLPTGNYQAIMHNGIHSGVVHFSVQ